MPQELICTLLVELARAGRRVVRLKGGDPFVFGRGGEEAQALLDAGIPFEVVPGVTSAVAAPAAAGIPVTHRGVAAAFTVVTGHRRHGEPDVDWPRWPGSAARVVVLMGVAQRGAIAAELMAGGMDPATPAAAVRSATTTAEAVIRCRLDELARDTRRVTGRTGDRGRRGTRSAHRRVIGRPAGRAGLSGRAVPRRRPATVDDVHASAAAMPHVTIERGPQGNAVYQVGHKSFLFFRTPRADAVDPTTGERYDDVIVIWVESADDKAALVQDPGSPFFTTPHFDGHPSVLVRASRLHEVSRRRARRTGPGRLAVPGLADPRQGLARRPLSFCLTGVDGPDRGSAAGARRAPRGGGRRTRRGGRRRTGGRRTADHRRTTGPRGRDRRWAGG